MRALERARLAALAASVALAGLTGLAGCGAAVSSVPNSAVLITLDTTRADYLGEYGRSPSVTPHLDRLAREGVLYRRAYASAPITLPSHASMHTGLYPIRHTVRDNGISPVPQTATTLAELAREAGHQTGAFIAASVLDGTFALDQGFEHYDAPSHQRRTAAEHGSSLPAARVVQSAVTWLAKRDPARPFFLWVHLFDPHAPYEPPEALRTDTDFRSLYAAEIQSMDASIGTLLDYLDEENLLASSTIVVVADHGEALGEHGEESHGTFLFEPVLRVPFLLRYPDGYRAGTKTDELVSVVDVHPTLAEAMGLSRLADLDGESLWRSTIPADRGIYFECYSGYLSYGWSPLAGWMDAKGKYVHSSKPQFFDVVNDPGERLDLIEQRGAEVEAYRAAIGRVAALPALEPGDAEGIDTALLSDIRALGYAALEGTAAEIPHPLAPSTRPSPVTRTQELADTYEAMYLRDSGKIAEGTQILERIVAQNPQNFYAVDQLVQCLLNQQRFPEAAAQLQRMIQAGRSTSSNYYYLGGCLWILERHEESIRALEQAVELAPREPLYLQKLAQLLRQLDRTDEALEYEQRLSSLPGG